MSSLISVRRLGVKLSVRRRSEQAAQCATCSIISWCQSGSLIAKRRLCFACTIHTRRVWSALACDDQICTSRSRTDGHGSGPSMDWIGLSWVGSGWVTIFVFFWVELGWIQMLTVSFFHKISVKRIKATNIRLFYRVNKWYIHTIPHAYGSLWRWKHWSVRQIKPARLAFGRTLI